MIDLNRNGWPQWFDVRLGHARVRVQGTDVPQAVAAARRQLCLELPRLWDLIRAARDEQFEVRKVQ